MVHIIAIGIVAIMVHPTIMVARHQHRSAGSARTSALENVTITMKSSKRCYSKQLLLCTHQLDLQNGNVIFRLLLLHEHTWPVE